MKYLFILMTAAFLVACHGRAKGKAKEAVNKTGEVVAKAGSEFVDGASKGIEESFRNEVVFSGELTRAGLRAGRISINSSDSATDDLLRVYFMFDKAIDRKITIKVFDGNGQEYGRASRQVKGQEGEAGYTDFVFDKRTNIDGKGKITFE